MEPSKKQTSVNALLDEYKKAVKELRSDFIRHDDKGNIALDSRNFPTSPRSSTALWSEPLIPHSLKNIGNNNIHIISVEIKT